MGNRAWWRLLFRGNLEELFLFEQRECLVDFVSECGSFFIRSERETILDIFSLKTMEEGSKNTINKVMVKLD